MKEGKRMIKKQPLGIQQGESADKIKMTSSIKSNEIPQKLWKYYEIYNYNETLRAAFEEGSYFWLSFMNWYMCLRRGFNETKHHSVAKLHISSDISTETAFTFSEHSRAQRHHLHYNQNFNGQIGCDVFEIGSRAISCIRTNGRSPAHKRRPVKRQMCVVPFPWLSQIHCHGNCCTWNIFCILFFRFILKNNIRQMYSVSTTLRTNIFSHAWTSFQEDTFDWQVGTHKRKLCLNLCMSIVQVCVSQNVQC